MYTYMHTGWRRGDETPSAGAGGGGRLWQRQNRTRELMIMMIMMKNEKKVKVKVVSGKLFSESESYISMKQNLAFLPSN